MNKKLILASILTFIVIIGAIVSIFKWSGDQESIQEPTDEQKNQTEQQEVIAGGRSVSLIGAGASFLHPQIDYWAKKFSEKHKNVKIDYSPVGSGAGQRQFLDKLVDYAGSDPPLTGEALRRAREDSRGLIQMPIVAGAVVVVYNIPGLEGRLRLTGEVIALIYLGEIERWDDPRIRELNPDLRLPAQPIVAVYRSDASGTTNIFTQFLLKSSNNLWPKELVGLSVDWPVAKKGRALGGKGNAGVAEIIAKTPYSIGYVEYSHAVIAGLPWALIKNRDGVFVDATPETISAAIAVASPQFPTSPDEDFSEAWKAVIYAPGKNSYPIASFSFLILYKVYPDPDKAEAIKAFVKWILTEGHKHMVQGYVALPQEVREYNLRALDSIRTN
ncbi:MAG: phosphate ABC transporter substrate-binding protein PstS [Acidilobaceae archaeon]